jgi:translation initiation factor 2 alpha subunit (eIF-2alpha)
MWNHLFGRKYLEIVQPYLYLEEFEDTKGVIIICKCKKDRQHNCQKKITKGQTTIYKTYT